MARRAVAACQNFGNLQTTFNGHLKIRIGFLDNVHTESRFLKK